MYQVQVNWCNFHYVCDEIELDTNISNNTIPGWFSKYDMEPNNDSLSSYNNTGTQCHLTTTGHSILSKYTIRGNTD